MSKDLMNMNDDFSLDPFNDNDEGFFDNLGRRLFGNLTNHFAQNGGRTNITEDKNNYKVAVQLPGFKKDSIHLDYRNNTLSVAAKHTNNKVSKNKHGEVISKEFGSNNIARQFHIPDVDFNGISATYNGGILNINLPKKHPTENDSHRIEIK